MPTTDLRRFRKCLRAGRIVPYFQPIVGLRTGNLAGFEILARWQHPDGVLLLPEKFVPAIEKAGAIGELTDKLLARAAENVANWQAKPLLSLNISPVELRDPSLPQRLKRIAEAGGLPLERLVLEITENALIGDLNFARTRVSELKNLGIRLALDDLGAGYSSLEYLQALPFDEIKIDARFVKQLNLRRESRQIVTAMLSLGTNLGLTTVAEGIEENAQAEVLASLGCGYGQGWLYGRPVPAEQVQGVIAKLSDCQSAGHNPTASFTPLPEEGRTYPRSAGNGTEVVEVRTEPARTRAGDETAPSESIAKQHHPKPISNPEGRKSIWSYFKLRRPKDPPVVSDDKAFQRAVVLLLRAIESYGISSDDASHEQLVSYIRDASEQFSRGISGDDALDAASEIHSRLKRHFWHAGRFFSARKQEYQKMVSMFMETVAALNASGHRAMDRLKEIEKSLHSATHIEDIRTNRLLLGQCLNDIRKELDRQESVSAGLRSIIQSETQAGNGDFHIRGAEDCDEALQDLAHDPVTGLPSYKQAEFALLEALSSGQKYFVVPIAAKGADVIYSHRGSEVGDSALYHFAEKLRSLIGEEDRLFRWRGVSFVVLVTRATITEVRRDYCVLSNMRLEDAIQVGTRLMWLPISASWDVIAMAPPYSSLVQHINQLVLPKSPKPLAG